MSCCLCAEQVSSQAAVKDQHQSPSILVPSTKALQEHPDTVPAPAVVGPATQGATDAVTTSDTVSGPNEPVHPQTATAAAAQTDAPAAAPPQNGNPGPSNVGRPQTGATDTPIVAHSQYEDTDILAASLDNIVPCPACLGVLQTPESSLQRPNGAVGPNLLGGLQEAEGNAGSWKSWSSGQLDGLAEAIRQAAVPSLG